PAPLHIYIERDNRSCCWRLNRRAAFAPSSPHRPDWPRSLFSREAGYYEHFDSLRLLRPIRLDEPVLLQACLQLAAQRAVMTEALVKAESHADAKWMRNLD